MVNVKEIFFEIAKSISVFKAQIKLQISKKEYNKFICRIMNLNLLYKHLKKFYHFGRWPKMVFSVELNFLTFNLN